MNDGQQRCFSAQAFSAGKFEAENSLALKLDVFWNEEWKQSDDVIQLLGVKCREREVSTLRSAGIHQVLVLVRTARFL